MQAPTPEQARQILAMRASKMAGSSPQPTPEQARQILAMRKHKVDSEKGWGETALDLVKDLPRNAAQVARSVAAGVGGVADLPLLPLHLGMMAAGKEPMFVSEGIKSLIDKATDNALVPKSTLGKTLAGGIEAVAGLKPTGSMIKAATSALKPTSKLVSKPLEWIEKGSEVTKPNIAATGAAGATMGAAADVDDMNPLAAMGLALGAGAGAHKLTSSLQRGGIKAMVAGHPGSALRHKPIGEHYQEGLGKNLKEFMDIKPKAVGKDISEAVERYHRHHSNIFGREEAAISKGIESWVNKASPKELSIQDGKAVQKKSPLMVDFKEPLDWSLGLLTKSMHPGEVKIWARSPLGKQTMELLNVPSEIRRLATKDPDQFRLGMESLRSSLVDKNTSIGKMPYQSGLGFRRALDNDVSLKQWKQIGSGDEKELQKLRYGMKEQLTAALKDADPKLQKRQAKYFEQYGKYAQEKTPFINKLRMEEPFHGNVYEKAKEDLHVHGYMPEFVTEALDLESPALLKNKKVGKPTKGSKENYVKAILKDIGRDGEHINIGKLQKSLGNLEEETRDLLMRSLSDEQLANLQKQLGRHKTYQKLQGESSPADITYRTHGIGLVHSLSNKVRQSLLQKYWKGEKGQRYLNDYVDQVGSTGKYTRQKAFEPTLKHMYKYQTLPRGVEYIKARSSKEKE